MQEECFPDPFRGTGFHGQGDDLGHEIGHGRSSGIGRRVQRTMPQKRKRDRERERKRGKKNKNTLKFDWILLGKQFFDLFARMQAFQETRSIKKYQRWRDVIGSCLGQCFDWTILPLVRGLTLGFGLENGWTTEESTLQLCHRSAHCIPWRAGPMGRPVALHLDAQLHSSCLRTSDWVDMRGGPQSEQRVDITHPTRVVYVDPGHWKVCVEWGVHSAQTCAFCLAWGCPRPIVATRIQIRGLEGEWIKLHIDCENWHSLQSSSELPAVFRTIRNRCHAIQRSWFFQGMYSLGFQHVPTTSSGSNHILRFQPYPDSFMIL